MFPPSHCVTPGTYGPRQSIFNPYTGVIAIFCTRLLNSLPPVLYEDGQQTRDFSFVEDIARANLLASETDKLDGLPVNIGSGHGTPIREIAEQLSDALKIGIAPEITANFVPAKCVILLATLRSLARLVTNRLSISAKASVVTLIGSAHNQTFVITSAKPAKF